jgi:diaminohydroxyphosphoribosylaminopyrimidine deaminase / 5-amino-6-(5-phosphoribosylamino)uracil reductase
VTGSAGEAAAADRRWMRRALLHARRGLGRTAPNPVVGACVVTAEGVVIGDGAHERDGEAHAEVHALAEAGDAARGATLYCTLEPCCFAGRTGACTERVIAAGIRRVVVAVEDPFPKVSGKGIAALQAHGIDVEVGVEREAATRLNQPFFTAVRLGRPFVILKAAVSQDGHIAGRSGTRTPLTSPIALRHAQYVRAEVDAIGVGSETLLVDDPLLTARQVYRERPLTRVVFDRRLRTPAGARVLSTLAAGPVVIVTGDDAVRCAPEQADALRQAGAVVLAAGDVHSALRALVDRGVHSLLLEGGTGIHTAAWSAGVIDYVQVYVAPTALGAAGVPMMSAPGFSLDALEERRVEQLGPDVLIEGYVHRPH